MKKLNFSKFYVFLISIYLGFVENAIAAPNPEKLNHEITFEQIKVWSPALCDGPLVAWGPQGCVNRSEVPDARYRGMNYAFDLMCVQSDKQSRSGKYSAFCESVRYEDEFGGDRSKRMFEVASNLTSGTDRRLRIGDTYWIGFSIYIETLETPPEWELYFQLHNNSPEDGWTSTITPQVALERDVNPNHFRIAWRYNEKGISTTPPIYNYNVVGDVTIGGWMDFVVRVRFSTPGDLAVNSDGLLEVYQRKTPKDELVKTFSAHNIKIGYGRSDPIEKGAIPSFGVYSGAQLGQAGRIAYLDEIRLGKEPEISITDVDPQSYATTHLQIQTPSIRIK